MDRSDREARKAFFSEEKKQKTFGNAVADSPERTATAAQKFFGSFFQKRTACLALPCLFSGNDATRVKRLLIPLSRRDGEDRDSAPKSFLPLVLEKEAFLASGFVTQL